MNDRDNTYKLGHGRGHMGIKNGRKCVQGSMGYNMDGGVDFNKGVHDKMGWKKGGNSGDYNSK